jgi:flavin reductase (DIM6/NTAB) family NADH-FMN oxidoreductase RutF
MISDDDYKDVMRNLASGVTIVTTALDGDFYGMTATSFTSVSLEPRLVQVSLDLESRTHHAVSESGVFGANILSVDQIEIARTFAIAGMDRFQDLEVTLGRETGVPLFSGAIGLLECRVTDEVPGGDHTIFVGEVLSTSTKDDAPLVHFRGKYHRLIEEETT